MLESIRHELRHLSLAEKHKIVLLVTLNRPQALKPINSQLADELINAVSAADKEEDVHSIVLTGSDKAFAAGADIKEMQQRGFPEMYSLDWFGQVEVDLRIYASLSSRR